MSCKVDGFKMLAVIVEVLYNQASQTILMRGTTLEMGTIRDM